MLSFLQSCDDNSGNLAGQNELVLTNAGLGRGGGRPPDDHSLHDLLLWGPWSFWLLCQCKTQEMWPVCAGMGALQPRPCISTETLLPVAVVPMVGKVILAGQASPLASRWWMIPPACTADQTVLRGHCGKVAEHFLC